VLLFDEVEKAHPDVFNVLLQLLDDGRLTDSHGRVVDFRNTVVILTSNIGADLLLEGVNEHGELSESARSGALQRLRHHFRPEFLNRLDDVVLFTPLAVDQVAEIVGLMAKKLARRLADQGITLVLSEEAKQAIAQGGYDPAFGARPLARYLQRHLETPIGRQIIGGELTEGMVLTVSAGEDGELKFEAHHPQVAAAK